MRTTLHKFVYLLDVYTAEASAGDTFTGERWRFLHFGPFAPAVAESIDELVGRGDIFPASKTRGEGDEEFTIYEVKRGLAPSLRDIGIPGDVALKVISDIHRFAKSLPDLLDHVYYRTAPMEQALPGNVLDFSGCESLPLAAFKPIEMKRIPKKRLAKARAEIRAMLDRENHRPQEPETGPYDEAYFSVMGAFDDSLPTGLTGRAIIKREE